MTALPSTRLREVAPGEPHDRARSGRHAEDGRISLRTKGVDIVRGPRLRETHSRAETCDPHGYHIELRQWFRQACGRGSVQDPLQRSTYIYKTDAGGLVGWHA
jgi:hypothetical protein